MKAENYRADLHEASIKYAHGVADLDAQLMEVRPMITTCLND
jgi:hypothetical protein